MSRHQTFPNSAVFYRFIYHAPPKILQPDSGISNHATVSFTVGDVIWDKVTWLPANLTALYYKTANFSVISTDWSHLWYSAVCCHVLRKCVTFKCVICLTVIGLTVDIIKERNDGKLRGIILVTVTWNRNKMSENLTLDFFILIKCKILQKINFSLKSK